jgi:phosphatidylglycerol:prolipoprotein diacylglycerol transferase
MSFHGGLIGTILAMAVFALRRNIPMLSLFDVAAASVTFGLFFGRIANFINAELWGRPTEAPWGMVFCNASIEAANGGFCPAGLLPRHPSQLYEAALEGILLFVVLRILTHGFGSLARPGLTGGAFIAGYGVARIAVEFFREPDAQLGYIAGFLTMGMILSLPMLLVGLGAMLWAGRGTR